MTLSKSFRFSLYAFLLYSISTFSQQKVNIIPLEREITKMDSLLFDVAFNKCDLNLFKTIMTEDIEFYDDRTGLNTSYEKEIAAFNDRCSKSHTVTRKRLSHSVYKLGDFGAVQTGEHAFYVDGNKVETAKFIMIWERKTKGWIVKRVVSYEHTPVN